MFQGSSELKHGTDSCIQSGQKARGLTAGEVGSWQFPGRIWWKWGEEGNRVECIWEDREGKGIAPRLNSGVKGSQNIFF